MPRPSIGDTPMTGAERQARYRATHANSEPVIRIRRTVDRRSRIQRWYDTIAGLTGLQEEYAAWLDALPAKPTNEKIRAGPWYMNTAHLLGCCSRNLSGPAVMLPHEEAGHMTAFEPPLILLSHP
jgi:hypothetical protein